MAGAAGLLAVVASVGSAQAAPAPSAQRRLVGGAGRPAPSACTMTVASIDRAGGYVERYVDLLAGTSKVGFRYPGVFAPGATALVNFAREAPDPPPEMPGVSIFYSLTAVSRGRLVSVDLTQSDFDSSGTPKTVKVDAVASRRGWGGFTRLVHAPYAPMRGGKLVGARNRLYGLTSAGVLYRYTSSISNQNWVSAGRVGGFGAVRNITLIGQNATSDVLLANTTTGSLITIRVTANGTMRTTVSRIRDRGWNGLEALTADRCNETDTVQTTALVGVDADTGIAYGYRMGLASGRRTTITPVGRIGEGWRDATYATQRFSLTGRPLRGA